jgi:2-methylisocitrate lyase-like PEP mutase family enzyme
MELHRSGTFVMVNVADAGTARAVCEAGAAAIATTSGGHAASIGRRDAAGDVTMEEHAQHTEVLVRAASVPCNADAENGYGHEPEDVAVAVRRFAAAGAGGMGIEDWAATRRSASTTAPTPSRGSKQQSRRRGHSIVRS